MQTDSLKAACMPHHHPEGATTERCILQDLGYFGHFLHMHSGGRSGKQHMLIKLYAAGGTLSQRDLQNTEPISSASLSEVLTKLEREGLVTRTRSAQDRRQLDVTLTDQGQAEARAWTEQRTEFESHALSILTSEERDELLATLDRLVEHWNALEEKRKKAMQE